LARLDLRLSSSILAIGIGKIKKTAVFVFFLHFDYGVESFEKICVLLPWNYGLDFVEEFFENIGDRVVIVDESCHFYCSIFILLSQFFDKFFRMIDPLQNLGIFFFSFA